MERPYAAGADERALAVDLRVLQIRVLAGPVYGVIVGTKELPRSAHL